MLFVVDEKVYHKLCFILAMGGGRCEHSSFILKHAFKKCLRAKVAKFTEEIGYLICVRFISTVWNKCVLPRPNKISIDGSNISLK